MAAPNKANNRAAAIEQKPTTNFHASHRAPNCLSLTASPLAPKPDRFSHERSTPPTRCQANYKSTKPSFFDAEHRVFLGDGSPGNWTLQDLHFPGWIQLLDFIHLIEHLHQAAKAASPKSHWPFYLRLLKAAWAGEPRVLLRTLKAKARNAGPPPPGADDKDPRCVLARAINYIETNRERMDYPRARRLGLPITTSYIESLINEFNVRVKTRRQFWCPSNVEGVLQVRAACLSTTQRWETFWDRRGARHAGRIRPPARPAA